MEACQRVNPNTRFSSVICIRRHRHIELSVGPCRWRRLTHLVATVGIDATIVTLDTGRMFPETYTVWAATEARYGIRIKGFYPRATDIEALVERQGIDGFYASQDARKACCHVRKVAPLRLALAGAQALADGAAGRSVAAPPSPGIRQLRRRTGDAEGQPDPGLVARMCGRPCQERRHPGQPAARQGIPVHRRRSLH